MYNITSHNNVGANLFFVISDVHQKVTAWGDFYKEIAGESLSDVGYIPKKNYSTIDDIHISTGIPTGKLPTAPQCTSIHKYILSYSFLEFHTKTLRFVSLWMQIHK